MLRKLPLALVALLALAACTPTQQTKPEAAPPVPPTPPAKSAQIGTFGLELADRDTSIKPGEDFYRYAIGHWLDTNQIPADRTAWGTFAILDSESEKRVKSLIEGLPANAAAGQPADEASFKKLVDSLADQYSSYTALPGLNLNGRLTLGENIGDLGGLSVAYEAYHLSLDGKEAPVIDGLTGDQRFFLSWAQAWRTLMRDERLRNQVMSDPHSPAKFRVNGVVRNMDAWYQAFNVQPGDALYLPPEKRVRIW